MILSSSSQSLDNSELVKLLTFDPLSLNEEEIENEFDKISDTLLNKYILYINNIPHQLIEIEFYLNSENHPDVFTHGNELQKQLGGLWYFHKSGNSYKSGNYKGLDITMATEGSYGGILIRGIINLETGVVIDGPSLTVDHILKLCNAKSVPEFVEDFDLHVHLKSKLFLAPAPKPSDYTVYKCGRVGLTLKVISEERIKYIGKFYRYLTRPKETKKGRAYLIAALYAQLYSADQIHNITKTPKGTVTKYIDLIKEGKKTKPEEYAGLTLSNQDICKLFGSLSNK